MKSKYAHPPGLFGLVSIVGGFASENVGLKDGGDSGQAEEATEPDYRNQVNDFGYKKTYASVNGKPERSRRLPE